MALAFLLSPRAHPTLAPGLEEVLVEGADRAGPALYVYRWSQPALVLGYGQRADEIDLDACRADGVTVVRRRTGGTGVYVNGDLGVSLALPRAHPWARTLGGLYDRFLDVLSDALAEVGQPTERVSADGEAPPRSPICFEGQLRESLLIDGRKAVGCAQMRRPHGVLVHATLLLGLDAGAQARAFGVPAARVQAGLAPLSIAARDPESLIAAIARGFSRALELPLDARPLPVVPEQLSERYAEPRWCPVPPRSTVVATPPPAA